MQTLHAILRSTVQCMIEWADTQVLRPVSRAILVCFGAFWKQPKKQRWMPARAAASRRTANNTEPRSLIFCSNHIELLQGLMLLMYLGPNQPRQPHLYPHLILNFIFTPHKNSICLINLIFRTKIFFCHLQAMLHFVFGHCKLIGISFGNTAAHRVKLKQQAAD